MAAWSICAPQAGGGVRVSRVQRCRPITPCFTVGGKQSARAGCQVAPV